MHHVGFKYIEYINRARFPQVFQHMGKVPDTAALITSHLDYITFSFQSGPHDFGQKFKFVWLHHRQW
ncbi:hypothetical protein PKCBPO_01469 [Methylorubrum thiocyanatum]